MYLRSIDFFLLYTVCREDLRNVCSLARATLVKIKYIEATGERSLSTSRASRLSNDKRMKNSVFLLVRETNHTKRADFV